MKKLFYFSFILFSQLSFAVGGNGPNITVTAGPSLQRFDIRGGKGADGADGYDGRSAGCDNRDGSCWDHGSNGGDGENGENGGNGGNIYVIYKDIEQVKNIYVNASGGKGGYGGRGGRGGDGEPAGRDGEGGLGGYDGYPGYLFLIPDYHAPLIPENAKSTASFSELIEGKTLVKQLWSEFDGAKDYLANGSIVDDTFFHLEGYEYGQAQVVFSDETKIAPYLLQDKCLTEYNEGETSIRLSPEHVGIVSEKKDGASSTLIIERLYRASVFHGLHYDSLIKKNGGYILQLRTLQDLVPHPKLSLQVVVEKKTGMFRWQEIFNGEVGEELVTSVPRGYDINFDQLVKVQTGEKIRITVTHQLKEMSLVSNKNSQTYKLKVP